MLNVIEIEYSELQSTAYRNYRYGMKIKTSPEAYEQDLHDLVIEVKTKLNNIVFIANAKKEENKKKAEIKK
jgi:hypothetical protein